MFEEAELLEISDIIYKNSKKILEKEQTQITNTTTLKEKTKKIIDYLISNENEPINSINPNPDRNYKIVQKIQKHNNGWNYEFVDCLKGYLLGQEYLKKQ